jgi:hypothetical protein
LVVLWVYIKSSHDLTFYGAFNLRAQILFNLNSMSSFVLELI